jgi:plasmid stabilization system protein ParE
MAEDLTYRVVWSRKAKEALKEIGIKALEFGGEIELDRVVKALKGITEQLQKPLTIGRIYRSRGSVEEHTAFQDNLAIDFAVDVQRQFVLVRDCWRVREQP